MPRQEERKARGIFCISLALSLKELNEAEVWIDVIIRSGFVDTKEMIQIQEERKSGGKPKKTKTLSYSFRFQVLLGSAPRFVVHFGS